MNLSKNIYSNIAIISDYTTENCLWDLFCQFF